MKICTLTPDQFGIWDNFVENSPQGDIFCYSWWLEATSENNFRIIAVFENNLIVAGIPLALDENGNINEPPLTRTLGILFINREYQSLIKQTTTERRWTSALLKHIPFNRFVQMSMHHNFNDWLPFRWEGFKQTTRYTYIISYKNRSTEELWNGMDRLRRRMITRAGELNISVSVTDDVELMYEYEQLSYSRQGRSFRMPLGSLKKLDASIKEKGKRLILKASDESGKVHAVIYIVFNERSAYALLSGGDPESRKDGGHTLVMWEAIKYFREKVEYFNFGGSDIQNIESHLRGFGGVLTPYFHIYNENMLPEKSGLRYHTRMLLFHLSRAVKSLINKIK